MKVYSLSAFARVICDLEQYSLKLPDKTRAKAIKWAERIVQSLYDGSGGDSRSRAMDYLLLLLDQVQKRKFTVPFDKQPCLDQPLCSLPRSMNLHPTAFFQDMNRQKFQNHILWDRILQHLCNAPEHICAIPGLEWQADSFRQNEKSERKSIAVVQEPNCPILEGTPSNVATNEQKRDVKRPLSALSFGNSNSDIPKHRSRSKDASAINCLGKNPSTVGNLNHHHHDERCDGMQIRKPNSIGKDLLLPISTDHQHNISAADKEEASGEKCYEWSQKTEPLVDYTSGHYARVAEIYRQSSMKKNAIERQVWHRLRDRL